MLRRLCSSRPPSTIPMSTFRAGSVWISWRISGVRCIMCRMCCSVCRVYSANLTSTANPFSSFIQIDTNWKTAPAHWTARPQSYGTAIQKSSSATSSLDIATLKTTNKRTTIITQPRSIPCLSICVIKDQVTQGWLHFHRALHLLWFLLFLWSDIHTHLEWCIAAQANTIALRCVWFGVVHTPFCARLFVLNILDMIPLIFILSYVIP